MTDAPSLAAPAPNAANDDEASTPEERRAISDYERLDALFEQWARWAYTRRLYAPPPSAGITLGALTSKSRGLKSRAGGPDAPCNSFLMALNAAIGAQPAHALDSQVFLAFYWQRISNVKAAAARIGVSRQHFYRLLRAFCTRVEALAKAIEATNLQAGEQLPHAGDRRAA